jgi:hypothetical protein
MEKTFDRVRGGLSLASALRIAGVGGTDSIKEETTIRALPLRMAARSIAANSGAKGAIVITLGKDGIHVAADGLNPEDVREALCTAIHASFLFDEER